MAEQDARFDQLKKKYDSALGFIRQSGVRLSHLHVHKLFIQGEAPSEQVKNKV
jgi:hypothetical protein